MTATNNLNSRIKTLIIEDNFGDIELLKLAFKESEINSQMDVITDGQDAITFLSSHSSSKDSLPNIIFLDLNLPSASGLEVLEFIKNQASLRHIPVIVLSTSKSQRDIAKCYELYANAYIAKPSGYEDFKRVVVGIKSFWYNSCLFQ